MFELIRDAIAAHQTIILHRHTNPDGDALGSQIGLKHLILANYPDKTVHMVGDGAGRYGFMEDSIMDEISMFPATCARQLTDSRVLYRKCGLT